MANGESKPDAGSKQVRRLARVIGTGKVQVHAGFLLLDIGFNYADGGEQMLGFNIDANFARGLFGVWGANHVDQIIGEVCYVSLLHEAVVYIEPVFDTDKHCGFDVALWASDRQQAREKLRQ